MSKQESELNNTVEEEAMKQEPAGQESSDQVTPEQLAELRERAAKAEEFRDQLLRVMADMDNLRKRAAREKQEAIRFANEGLIEKLLPILDNFEMAMLAASSAEGASVESLKTGVNMILGQLKSLLSDAGLEEVPTIGQKFDPNVHEAVSQMESAEVEEGHVLQQLRRGYKLKERLLRPSTVVVAKKPGS